MIRLKVTVSGRCAGEPFLSTLDLINQRATFVKTIEKPLPQIPLGIDRRSIQQLASGAWGLIKQTIGIDRTPLHIQPIRQSICENCPSGFYDFGVCVSERGGCGCFLDAKIRIAKERCPEEHWESCDAD